MVKPLNIFGKATVSYVRKPLKEEEEAWLRIMKQTGGTPCHYRDKVKTSTFCHRQIGLRLTDNWGAVTCFSCLNKKRGIEHRHDIIRALMYEREHSRLGWVHAVDIAAVVKLDPQLVGKVIRTLFRAGLLEVAGAYGMRRYRWKTKKEREVTNEQNK